MSLLDGYEEPIEYQKPPMPDDYVSLLDGYVEPQKTSSKKISIKGSVNKFVPTVNTPVLTTNTALATDTIPQQQPPIQPLNVDFEPIPTLPQLPPEAGIIPMTKRIGESALQGLVNLPNALVDFAHQSIDSGKTEFQSGYNPIHAFGAASIGAMQGLGNLAEGVWNLPGDFNNAYWGYEKTLPTHPITQGIPQLIGKTDIGRNYLENVDMLLQRYPLTAMLSQEVGEELPGMIGGAAAAKYGIKSGKLAKTAEKMSDVGYKKLALHSAVGGFTDGLIVDPAQAQEFNMTPEQRRASRFTNAYTGAVLAPTINLGTKGVQHVGVKSFDSIKTHAPKLSKATREVSAKVFNNAKELYNSANDKYSNNTAFDSMRKLSKGELLPVKDNMQKNAVITAGNSAFDVWKNLPKEKTYENSVSVTKAMPTIDKIAPNIAKKKKKRITKKQIEEENLQKIINDISDVQESKIPEITKTLHKFWLENYSSIGTNDRKEGFRDIVKGYKSSELKNGNFYYSVLDANNLYEIIDIDGQIIKRNITTGSMPWKMTIKSDYPANYYRKFIPEKEETIKNSFNLNEELKKEITEIVRKENLQEKETFSNNKETTSANITPEIINKYKEKFPGKYDIVPSDIKGHYKIVYDEEHSSHISAAELKAVANFEVDKNAPYPDYDSVSLYAPVLDDKYSLVFRKNLTKKSRIEILFDRVGEKEFSSFQEAYEFIKKHNLDVENISSYEKEIRKLQAEKITQKIAPKTSEKQKTKKETIAINEETIAKDYAKSLLENQIKEQKKYIAKEEKNNSTEHFNKSSRDHLNELEKALINGNYDVNKYHKEFANNIINKNAESLINLLAQGRRSNVTSKKLFEKYTGIKLPSTIEGIKKAVIEWSGLDYENWKREKTELARKKQLEDEKIAKEKNLESVKLLFKHKMVKKNGELMTIEEMFNRLYTDGYKLTKIKRGKKQVYQLRKDFPDKGYTSSIDFSSRDEKTYIDYLWNQDNINNKNHEMETQKASEKGQKPVIIKNNEKKGTHNEHISATDELRPRRTKKKSGIEKASGTVRSGKSRTNGSISEIGRVNDTGVHSARRLISEHEELINAQYKKQHDLNTAIEKFISDKEYAKYQGEVPDEIKGWIKKYTGAGGLEKQGAEGRGLLSEYYTPHDIVKQTWDLVKKYTDTDGSKILEPSVGIGRFFDYAPVDSSLHGIEMNPVSAKIAELLHPNAKIENAYFQEKFIDKTKNVPLKKVTPEYDIVIGNPPYGKYSGRYKGLGEGKGIEQIEQYFIKRGLDVLKDDGILAYIVPSSFLKGEATKSRLEIAKNAIILDAVRLPENTFNTTSIGTDIIILQKKENLYTKNDFYLDNWFNKHPDKIMGETLTRKNKYGKTETYVKKTQLPLGESKVTQPKNSINKNVSNDKTSKNSPYKDNYTISKEDYQLFADTLVDGTLPKDKYSPNEKVNQFKGKLYNDFNYLQGDIYNKLDALENENITEAQKTLQRQKLQSVLPKAKNIEDINFVPTSEFIRELSFGKQTKESWNFDKGYFEETILDTLDTRFISYVKNLSSSERNNMPAWDIINFIKGDRVNARTYGDKEQKAAAKIEYITKLKNTTDSLFNQYIQTQLTKEDKKILQDKWNRTFNAIYNPNYKQVPLMVKNLSSTFFDKPLNILDVQKEGINFLTNKGVGLLGFEVGVGKTLTGIVATVQNMQMGRCKRPLILAPKQVKANWIREMNQLFPDVKVVDVNNLSKFKGKIEDGTISIGTYEALGNIWFDEKINKDSEGHTYRTGAIQDLIDKLYNVSTDFNRDSTNRAREQQREDIEKIVGIAEKNNKKSYKIDELGFDHLTVDEAHNFRNLFRQAKAYGRDNNAYQNVGSGGNPSSRAARLFFLAQHILDKNDNRNVFFLTATPFNNSPLEVFNMLSFIGKDMLDKMGLYNVYQFMDTYADITSDWVVKSNNDVDYTQVTKGFKNAASLREVIKSLMLIRSADDAKVKRPDKHVERLVLEPSDKQLELIDKFETEAMTGKKNDGAILKCINQSRQVTLSPDIATKNYSVSAEDFVNNSPKLKYIANAISILQKRDPSTSQLLYMPLGVEFLPKLKEYFVNNNIFKPDEIEIISSQTNDDKIPKITDSFNDPDGAVKLIIGTQKIKEGMNLNKNTSVLYIPFIDWNPTDFLQIVGRVWRQGNRYNDIKVVVPLLKNSSDPFMFQKLDEKTSRINNIMDESKEYIETGELNTAEEKLNMITVPEKKVQMFQQLQEKNIERAETELNGRFETTKHYKNILEDTTQNIANLKDKVEFYKIKLKNTPKDDTKNYEYHRDNVKSTENALKKAQNKLEAIKNTITKLEIDFEGKDSKESIMAELEKLEQKKNELSKVVEEQLEKYRVDYFKEQQNKIPLETHLKNFEKSLDKLYGKNEESFDSLPENTETFKKTAESDFNVSRIKLKTQSQRSSKERQKAKLAKLKAIENTKPQKKVVQEMIHSWAAEIDTKRYTANRDLNFFINRTKVIAKGLKTKDKLLREILPFLRERTEIPEALDRPDLKDLWNRLTKKDKEKLTKLADSFSEKFDKFWQEYQGLNADEAVDVSKSAIENHISHLWDVDNRQKSLLTNYFATKSRFAKKRTIETLFDGINGIVAENGELIQFKPKTLDYAEILKIQSDSLIKAVADKRLANDVKNLKNSDGLSLVLPSHKAPSDWVEIDHPAINKTIAKPLSSSFGEIVSPKLQNILSEMGIAIGRRLNKYKAGGELNALGKYLHSKQPPEIRLQRWFSNKTLAHEIGHALDKALNLKKESFVTRYKDEILAINKDRIANFTKLKKKAYATKDSELTAEFFAYFFNDFDRTYKLAPRATSHIIDLISNNETFKKLLPNNFNWNNAKHVLEESKLELIKTKVRVHPDIADTIKIVFEKQGDPTVAGKVYDNINAVLKQFNLGFSGFHAVALSEAALANLGLAETIKILNPVEIFRSLLKNDWDIYKKDTLAKQAIDDGLQLGATLDVHRRITEKLIEDTGVWAEKNIPLLGKPVTAGTKIISFAQKLNNKVLWDYLHNNYKLATYQALIQAESAKGKLSQAQRRAIAQWVNDSYGGQVWENLGIKPSGRKWEQRLFLSPDWLRSTTRQALAIISHEKLSEILNNKSKDSVFWEKAKILGERWGIGDLTEDVNAVGTRKRIARRFWRNAFIQYCIYANAINAIFREKDREDNPELYPKKMSPKDYSIFGNSMKHQSHIFIGRNSDGTERYMRLGKQFREVPELATNFTEKIGGKASPTLQLMSQTFTGKSLSGFENREITESKGLKKTAAIAKMWAKAPLPYSMSSLFNSNKDVSLADFFAGTSKGMTFYKGQEFYKAAIKNGDKKEIQKITKDLIRNKVNPSDVFNFAIRELKKEARREARKM